MPARRWIRIIPVALVMYTIASIDRTNVFMAQKDMIRDLGMDQEQAGAAIGIFFWGYLLLQIPGGYLATRWSAKKCISVPGPFAALGPFWAIPTENLPRSAIGTALGLINALGCLGGFFGIRLAGSMARAGDIRYGFALLGLSFLVASGLTALVRSPARTDTRIQRAEEVLRP